MKQEGKYTDTARGRVDSIERLVETVPILSEIFDGCKITFYKEESDADTYDAREVDQI